MNENSRYIKDAQGKQTAVERHVEHTDRLMEALQQQASLTIKGIAAKIAAIEDACGHTITTLTNQLTNQCKEFNSVLQRFADRIANHYVEIDALKSMGEEWAKNHFKLETVEQCQEEMEKEIADLKQQNQDLKEQVAKFLAHPLSIAQ